MIAKVFTSNLLNRFDAQNPDLVAVRPDTLLLEDNWNGDGSALPPSTEADEG